MLGLGFGGLTLGVEVEGRSILVLLLEAAKCALSRGTMSPSSSLGWEINPKLYSLNLTPNTSGIPVYSLF